MTTREGGEDDGDTTWRSLLWTVDVLSRSFEVAHSPEAVRSRRSAASSEDGGSPEGPAAYGLDAYDDAGAYRRWLAEIDTAGGAGPVPPSALAVSLVVASPGEDPEGLRRCVSSVSSQTHPAWELILWDDEELRPEVRRALEDLAESDSRITVVAPGHQPAGGHGLELLARTSGALVALLDPAGELTPEALATVAWTAEREPDADVLYSDEDELDEDGLPVHPRFKPGWSPELLLACPYVGHLTAVRRSVLDAAYGSVPTTPSVDAPAPSATEGHPGAALHHDVALRATERARRVVHIPRVLYRARRDGRGGATLGASGYEAARRVVAGALARRGRTASVEPGLLPGSFRVRWPVERTATVSVIIPFRDEGPMLRACVDALGDGAGHDRFEVVLVDNGSVEPETLAVCELLCRRPGVRLLEHPGPFNWSAINNAAAATCGSDVLLFMNNDVVARGDGWMRAMLEHAQRPEIGAVGCRLLYPDGTVQHAGVVLGMHVLAGHVMCGLPGDLPGYTGWAKLVKDYAAVSAACMMCRRSVFEELGGFDESYAVAFNDVDFCLRLGRAGYRVVYTPYAELVHHESRTRGMSGFYGDYQAFLGAWTDVVRAGDPFYNVNLSRLDLRCILRPLDEDGRWETLLSRLTSSSGR